MRRTMAMAFVFVILTIIPWPAWAQSQGSYFIRDITVLTDAPDKMRFQAEYEMSEPSAEPLYISAYLPQMHAPAQGFSYLPSSELTPGETSGKAVFSVMYDGPASLSVPTMEVMLYSRDKILASRVFELSKTWKARTNLPAVISCSRPLVISEAELHECADYDGDGLEDSQENFLAEQCVPYLQFDSHENARQDFEPVTLFQVRPLDVSMPEKPHVRIVWALLFSKRGNNGSGSLCGGARAGDIVMLSYDLASEDAGKSWRITHINLGENVRLIWQPSDNGIAAYGSHPVLYVSAGSHQLFFNKDNNQKKSPYSIWGCNVRVDGAGARVLPDLKALDAAWFSNVGEPESHPAPYFLNDLSRFFAGQSAWGESSFLGSSAGVLAKKWLYETWPGRIKDVYRFRALSMPDNYMRHRRFLGEITPLYSSIEKRSAMFKLVPGLADKRQFSLMSRVHPDYYLANQDGRLRLLKLQEDTGWLKSATFKIVPGLADPSGVSFEAKGMPGYYIRHKDGHLIVEKGDDTQFRRDATFIPEPPMLKK